MHYFQRSKELSQCSICGKNKQIAAILSVCSNCIKEKSDLAHNYTQRVHHKVRERLALPSKSPQGTEYSCNLCLHNCGLDNNQKSYCGLRENKDGEFITFVKKSTGIMHYYLDPLPCNCCAAWFCPAGTGNGYPEYASKQTKEIGYYNLSIFFYGCSFNCLFCQNQSHKSVPSGSQVSVNQLLNVFKNNEKVNCVCFFGGSPEPHFPFALELSEQIASYAKKNKRISRICWEWNGSGNLKYIKEAANFSLQTGGNIKFDLKAWNPSIHKALTGVDNKHTIKNFRYIGENYFHQRKDLPVLNATTLLVPGYIDEEEVENIAKYIASINDNIPYSLLGFYPHFEFNDLPLTSLKLAESCYEVAKKYLKNVNIGNRHLLI